MIDYKKNNIMKHNLQYLVAAVLLSAAIFYACDKKPAITNFPNAQGAPVLKSSTTTIAPTPADSSNNALVLTWSNPRYATDSASEKYVIQIDSTGRKFSQAVNITVSGVLRDSFTAKQINTIALGFGFSYNVAYGMDVRIISSYGNNNEQLTSNTLTLTVTPYVIPPKVIPPGTNQLFIVGSATYGGWNNPVPVPTQQFERIDSVTYGGVFKMIGAQQFLLLPINGDWTNKYAIANANVPATGGTFGYNGNDPTYNTNFNGPADSGWYVVMVSFQAGTFTVTPYTQFIPDSLFLVGSATVGGWNNPVPEPAQVFTQVNSTQFSITLPLAAASQYLLLPVNGSWTNKFAVANANVPASGGPFGYNGNNGTYNTNFNGPANAGTYTLIADFLNYQYTVTQ
jgi:hypothetical protein